MKSKSSPPVKHPVKHEFTSPVRRAVDLPEPGRVPSNGASVSWPNTARSDPISAEGDDSINANGKRPSPPNRWPERRKSSGREDEMLERERVRMICRQREAQGEKEEEVRRQRRKAFQPTVTLRKTSGGARPVRGKGVGFAWHGKFCVSGRVLYSLPYPPVL